MTTAQTPRRGNGAAPPAAPAGPPATAALAEMLMATRVQQAVSVAASLRLADHLDGAPRDVAELAELSGAHADALRRLLRCLVSYGVFAEDEQGRFTLTPLSAPLRTSVPGSMQAVAVWCGAVAIRVFAELEYSVRTGEPAFDRVFGAEFYAYLADNPETGSLFDAFMAAQTARLAATLPDAYDFSSIGTLVDVGGGSGQLLAAVLRAQPDMRGVLFDQPHVLEHAHAYLARAGVADRCMTVPGDMNQRIPPGGDAYVLKSIVHGLDDDDAIQILRRCREALGGDARVLLVELVMPLDDQPHPAKLMDLLMLAGTHGGRERSEDEFRRLLERAGLSHVRTVPSPSGYSVLEAAAA